jgi:hypothetical protein
MKRIRYAGHNAHRELCFPIIVRSYYGSLLSKPSHISLVTLFKKIIECSLGTLLSIVPIHFVSFYSTAFFVQQVAPTWMSSLVLQPVIYSNGNPWIVVRVFVEYLSCIPMAWVGWSHLWFGFSPCSCRIYFDKFLLRRSYVLGVWYYRSFFV